MDRGSFGDQIGILDDVRAQHRPSLEDLAREADRSWQAKESAFEVEAEHQENDDKRTDRAIKVHARARERLIRAIIEADGRPVPDMDAWAHDDRAKWSAVIGGRLYTIQGGSDATPKTIDEAVENCIVAWAEIPTAASPEVADLARAYARAEELTQLAADEETRKQARTGKVLDGACKAADEERDRLLAACRKGGHETPTPCDGPEAIAAEMHEANSEAIRQWHLAWQREDEQKAADEGEQVASKRACEARRRLVRAIMRADGSPIPHPAEWSYGLDPAWRATFGGRAYALIPDRSYAPKDLDEAAEKVHLVCLGLAAEGGDGWNRPEKPAPAEEPSFAEKRLAKLEKSRDKREALVKGILLAGVESYEAARLALHKAERGRRRHGTCNAFRLQDPQPEPDEIELWAEQEARAGRLLRDAESALCDLIMDIYDEVAPEELQIDHEDEAGREREAESRDGLDSQIHRGFRVGGVMYVVNNNPGNDRIGIITRAEWTHVIDAETFDI